MRDFTKSTKLLDKAKKVTPLGAQTYSKSYRYFCEGSSPAFIERGLDAKLWDVDGNEYIDFICSLGAITIGYSNKKINEAIKKQLDRGIIFSQPAPCSIELAEKLIEIIPCAEMVRFVKNGSDATSAAIRLARAYTNKDMILVCGYHGMQDWYIGSTMNKRGIPKEVSNLTKSFSYNNIESLKMLFEENKGEVAAVILEPIQGDGPKEGFLEQVKKIAHENGSLLIFDEVVSGFRYALGGASELYNVIPDMSAIGKGMSNGMPLSAVVGKKEILKLIEEGIFISTTFGGETLSIVSAIETIKILSQDGVYKKIWDLGKKMKMGLAALIKKYELEDVVKISGLEPHCGVVFEDYQNLDYLDINSIFSEKMVENGILTIGINNIMMSHTEHDIDMYLIGVEHAFKSIREAIDKKNIEGILKGKKVNPIFKRNIK